MRAALAFLLMTFPAHAEPRPVPRPGAEIVVLSEDGSTEVPDEAAVARSVRPVQQLEGPDGIAAEMAAAAAEKLDDAGTVQVSDRPETRPEDRVPAEPEPAPATRVPPSETGSVALCGRRSIVGETIAPVTGPGGCGIPDAVRIRQVSGLRLTRPARMDCTTAQTLDDWVRDAVIPGIGRRGGGPVALRVAAGYACRPRNNQPGAKMSEHALGHAIDIAAIRLADGSELSVLRDWDEGAEGRVLRALWRAACGPFGTVLGPESDSFHQDHFHLDTARYRNGGAYCR
ncbi:extensin family protein [uncultured Jannaschia sp.]|uniref:extensin-like domain-containing protein n=1 Tax=uncultured Jannaschia sp. TaxID=293347 RepID=UPI002609BDD6|nr:extensin family protein [uncultured Jannaschia sp.]